MNDFICKFYNMMCSSKNIIKEQSSGSLHDITTKIQADRKILDLFCSSGKGGSIEIVGEPIFPLKLTIDFLMQSFVGSKIAIKKSIQTSSHCPNPRPQNSSQKENKHSEAPESVTCVVIEGTMVKNGKSHNPFTHTFTIKNDKITNVKIKM